MPKSRRRSPNYESTTLCVLGRALLSVDDDYLSEFDGSWFGHLNGVCYQVRKEGKDFVAQIGRDEPLLYPTLAEAWGEVFLCAEWDFKVRGFTKTYEAGATFAINRLARALENAYRENDALVIELERAHKEDDDMWGPV